jgi:hypothetical protein
LAVRCIGLLLVVAAVACNGSDGDDDDATPTTAAETTTTAAPTTTQPTTTTFPIAGPEPWTDIVRDIYERSWQLAASPNPDAVQTVYSPDCDCFQTFLTGAQQLAANDQHYEGEPPQPIAVMLQGQGGGGFQTVTVKVSVPATRVVDAAGNVVTEYAAQGEICESLLLAPTGAGDAYRIHDHFVGQRCPEGL